MDCYCYFAFNLNKTEWGLVEKLVIATSDNNLQISKMWS